MNAWLLIVCLVLLEMVAILLAGTLWHDRLRLRLRQWIRPAEAGETDPALFAGRLAEAHRHLRWLRDKAAAAGLPGSYAASFDMGLDGLCDAAERLAARPMATMELSQGLLNACEQLLQILEQQITPGGAPAPAPAAPTVVDEQPAAVTEVMEAEPEQAADPKS